jgi:hypothetical protein
MPPSASSCAEGGITSKRKNQGEVILHPRGALRLFFINLRLVSKKFTPSGALEKADQYFQTVIVV